LLVHLTTLESLITTTTFTFELLIAAREDRLLILI
jgi:hypothetical protein